MLAFLFDLSCESLPLRSRSCSRMRVHVCVGEEYRTDFVPNRDARGVRVTGERCADAHLPFSYSS